ncbi:hypothetical protein KEM52_000392 [Ascosphaera acerosa]|nr:hypothetical protein KEM52_000392 [Ascosphaera acerosa]
MRSNVWSLLVMGGVAWGRLCTYIDRYHNSTLPPRSITSGIDCVLIAFINSTYPIAFENRHDNEWYNLDAIKEQFDEDTEFWLTVGNWGDSSGFEQASLTPESRSGYADNLAKLVNEQGFDGADIDWEYPGGHGADYKIHNDPSERQQEVRNYPLFLKALQESLSKTSKKLSIAVPGKKEDMLAYTAETARDIFGAVDYVNIMSYDLTNRRSQVTGHLSSVQGSLESVMNYLDLGLDPGKAVLGFPFYAEYYTMQPGCAESSGLGCPIVPAEDAQGMDAKTSGVLTFQRENFASPPAHLGASPTAIESFRAATANGIRVDHEHGAAYAVDTQNNLFWTWDSPAFYDRKFTDIVNLHKLGGVMAWSLGEDSQDWAHIKKLVQLNQQYSS